jgi:hypothetical protein
VVHASLVCGESYSAKKEERVESRNIKHGKEDAVL